MESLLHHAFRYAPIGIGLVTLKGTFIEVNPALCQILGYTEKQLLTLTVEKLTHPDDYTRDIKYAEALLHNKYKTYEMEKRFIHRLGYYVWLQVNVSLARDEKGNPLYFISQVQDITEKRKLREELITSEAKYRLIAENTTDLVGILDSTLKIVYASPSHQKLLGYSVFEGLDVCTLFFPEDTNRVLEKFEEMRKTKNQQRFELRLMHTLGQILYTETDVAPVFDDEGQLELIVYVTRDISQKKRADELISQSEKLYRSLYEGLKFISNQTQRVKQRQDLMDLLVRIVGDVFETDHVGVVSVDGEGTHILPSYLTAIQLPDENLYATNKPLVIQGDYIFTRMGVSNDPKYFLVVENHLHSFQKPLIQWLLTISRFSEIVMESMHQVEDILSELKLLLKEKQGPAWLSRLLFKVAEEQRVKLSIDLHDTALQEQIIWYRKLTEFIEQAQLSHPLMEQLKVIQQGFEEVMNQIRITCNELSPPFLKRQGIVKALELMFNQTSIRLGGYAIHFEHQGTFDQLNDDQILGIYRIVQELLSNATKHSKATEIQLSLQKQNNEIKLTYQDNGIGMEEQLFYGTTKQIGLYGIQERVRSLEGKIDFKPSEAGLQIEILLPLEVDWYDESTYYR